MHCVTEPSEGTLTLSACCEASTSGQRAPLCLVVCVSLSHMFKLAFVGPHIQSLAGRILDRAACVSCFVSYLCVFVCVLQHQSCLKLTM